MKKVLVLVFVVALVFVPTVGATTWVPTVSSSGDSWLVTWVGSDCTSLTFGYIVTNLSSYDSNVDVASCSAYLRSTLPPGVQASGGIVDSSFTSSDPADGAVTIGIASSGGGGGGLTTHQSDSLDLAWWGIWALVGLMFILIMAPRWYRAFDVTKGF
jgi:hypothetical protein